METNTKFIVALGVALVVWALVMAYGACNDQPDIVVQRIVEEKTVYQPVETRTVVEREVQVVQPLDRGADCVGVATEADNEFVLRCVRRAE